MRLMLICVLSVIFTAGIVSFIVGLVTLVPLGDVLERALNWVEAHNGVLIGLGFIALGCMGLPLLKSLAP